MIKRAPKSQITLLAAASKPSFVNTDRDPCPVEVDSTTEDAYSPMQRQQEPESARCFLLHSIVDASPQDKEN